MPYYDSITIDKKLDVNKLKYSGIPSPGPVIDPNPHIYVFATYMNVIKRALTDFLDISTFKYGLLIPSLPVVGINLGIKLGVTDIIDLSQLKRGFCATSGVVSYPNIYVGIAFVLSNFKTDAVD
jgi:hypothetical protein